MTDTQTNGNGSILHLTRHDNYYIAGADLNILVEHIQFRVHRYFFERESKYFASKLAVPASPGQQPVGSSDSNAIVLEDLTSSQFEKFLWVFYNPRYSIYDAGADVWETILTLSERWGFPEVKKLSVRELEKKEISDVKRIKLYHANKVDRNILIPRYAALCEREEPLTLEEGMDLGMETTLQIAKGREEVRAERLPSGARSPLTPTVHGEDLREVIRGLFKIAPASTDTVDEAPIITGALTPQKQVPKTVIQPAAPVKKPAEKPKIQTQAKTPTNKKGTKGPQTPAPSTTTTTTSAKETKPQSPPKQAEPVAIKGQEEPKEDENKKPVPAAEAAVAGGQDSGAANSPGEPTLINIINPTPTITTVDFFTNDSPSGLPDPFTQQLFSPSLGQTNSTSGNGDLDGFSPNLF